MKNILFMLFLAAACTFETQDSTAQSSTQEGLIPRTAFFTGEERFAFKITESGTTLYFQNNKNRQSVFFCRTAAPEKIDSIEYEGNILQFQPIGEDLLVIWKDSEKIHLSVRGNEIPLPMNPVSLRLVSGFNTRQEIALEVQTSENAVGGIYILDSKTSELNRKYDLQPFSTLFFDKDFNLIAANGSNNQEANALYYFKKGSWKEFLSADWGVDQFLGGFTKIISVSSDGKKIYYTSNKNTDKSRLYIFDIQSKKSKKIAESDLVDLLPFGASIDSKGHVGSVVGLYAKTIRMVIDKDAKNDFEEIQAQIKGDISFAQTLDEDRKWLIREFTGGPAKIYLYDRQTKNLKYLLSDYPLLDGAKLANRTAFEVLSRDSLRLPIHVYLPAGSDKNGDGIPDKPLPTILYVHGGPWAGVVHWNQIFHWRNFQLLANRGYAVINCEFRAGSGLGKAFVEKSRKTWGTDMTQDKVSISEWALKSKIALPDKIGIWGWSYGGYATMAGLAFAPETYACGVAMYGISDLEAFAKIPFANNDFWQDMVGNPHIETEEKMLREYSPINYIQQIKSPLLLTTGSKDLRVPQNQSDNMAAAMKRDEKAIIYFYYPEEGHDYRDDNSWISFWSVTEHFLKDYLGGKAQALGTDFELGEKVVVEGLPYIEKLKLLGKG